MNNFILVISFCFFSFTAASQVESEMEDKGLGAFWFKTLPESQSLFSRGVARANELPRTIKALIWNIKKASVIGWKAEFLKYGHDKDLFIIQEAYETEKFERTIELFNVQWDMGASFLYRRDGDAATGTMIGSTARPTEVLVRHSPDREPVVATHKALTFAKYNIQGREDDLLVISVHAINFETSGAFKRQMDQVEEEVSKHIGPVLLAGDFNTWNNSRAIYLGQMIKRLGMVESAYKNGHQRMTFRGQYLDHIFTRGASVKTAEVVGSSSGSDHKPFLVEMIIP